MTEWVSGSICIRPSGKMKAGTITPGHTHNFDHTTIVFSGTVHLEATKLTYVQRPPRWWNLWRTKISVIRELVAKRDFGDGQPFRHFLVKADVEHEITALVDDTEFWCVYSHRDPQGDVSVEVTGFEDAYS